MSAFGNLIPHQSVLGKGLHKMCKAIVMNAMSYMNGITEQVIKDKVEKNLWVNPQIKILYEIFTEIIERDEIARKAGDDPIRTFYINMRDTACAILDEDSHYLLRFFLFWELMHERYPEFRACTTTGRAAEIYKWELTYEALKRQREAALKGERMIVPSSVQAQRAEKGEYFTASSST